MLTSPEGTPHIFHPPARRQSAAQALRANGTQAAGAQIQALQRGVAKQEVLGGRSGLKKHVGHGKSLENHRVFIGTP